MSSIQLNWNAISPLGSTYTVLRNGGILVTALGATSYLDATVADNTTYTYVVFATNQNGPGLPSNVATVTTPPAQVTGLTAAAVSSSTINLSWTATPGATGYTVYRGGVAIATPSGTTYSSTGLSASTTYTYTVTATGAGGSGPASAPASATTQSGGTATIKAVQGHWIYIDQGQSFDAQFARMQTLATRCPHVRGFQFLWKWANLESPTTPGDYSGNWAAAGQAGDQLVKRFADYAASVGKLIHVNNFTYGGNVGQPNSAGTAFLADQMPAFMAGSPTSPYGPDTAATNGINGSLWQNCYPQTFSQVRSFMRFWVPAVAQRLLALSGHLASVFDTHPGFGMFSPCSESTLPLSGISYSIAQDEAVFLGANGFFAQMRAQWPHTALRYWANYLDTSDTMSTYLNAAVANKWLVGGPDTLNDPYDPAFNGTAWAPAWNSTTTYRFAQVVSLSGTNYFSVKANTNSQPAHDIHNVSTNPNWVVLGTGTRNITADYVWQGRNNDNTVNANYTNHVGQGGWGADVEPLDLDTSHDDGVNFHHVQHANKLGANCLFWYDLEYNSSNSTPPWNMTNTSSPNLLDWIESCAQGGNVNVNGAVAGIALTNASLYPPTW